MKKIIRNTVVILLSGVMLCGCSAESIPEIPSGGISVPDLSSLIPSVPDPGSLIPSIPDPGELLPSLEDPEELISEVLGKLSGPSEAGDEESPQEEEEEKTESAVETAEEAPEEEPAEKPEQEETSGGEITRAWISEDRSAARQPVYTFFSDDDFTFGGMTVAREGEVRVVTGRLKKQGEELFRTGGTEIPLVRYRIESEDPAEDGDVLFGEYREGLALLQDGEDAEIQVLREELTAKEYAEEWKSLYTPGKGEPLAVKSTAVPAPETEQGADTIGSDALRMPGLRKLHVSAALKQLEEYKVGVELWEVPSPEYAAGTVISQSIPEGMRVFPGDTVVLTVAGARKSAEK